MRITVKQEKILNGFVCERLSSNPINIGLMDAFVSKRGESLVNYLKRNGLSEDQAGETAYYVIKNEQKEIMMFFSIKCGALFDPLLDEEVVQKDFQRLITLLQAIRNAGGKEETEEVDEIFNKYRVDDRLSTKDYLMILKKVESKRDYLKALSEDRATEDNKKIFRVLNTHPAIELVHFCTDDNIKREWYTYGLGHTMGEVLFWKFIAPKFFEIQEIAGCEYAFLFAADLSEDGTLVNYYDVTLKFQKSLEVGTNKPFYDFCCDFMCQKVNDMRERYHYFFEHFNIDDRDDAV
ncbi:MAG: hypothetical protein NC416_05445 [Eubacterium sp.]|nr:hypothetical protein [Eubacterium sp.]